MLREAENAVDLLRRRAWTGVFLASSGQAVAVSSVLMGSLLLIARALGILIVPSAWWAFAVILVAGWAAWRATAWLPSRRSAAVYVDHHLRLGGLLASGLEIETGIGDWAQDLTRRLAAAPRLDLRVLAGRPWIWAAAGGVFLGIVLALPPPPHPVPKVNPAVESALADVRQAIEELRQKDAVDLPDAADLLKRLDRLETQLAQGETPAWADVDALEKDVERARDDHARELERLGEALGQVAQGGQPNEAEKLAKLIEDAKAKGLLTKLPPELLAKLGIGESGAVDPSRLPTDPAALSALAKELGALTEKKLDDLAKLGLADPDAARRLAAASKAERDAGEEHVHDESCRDGH